MSHLFYLSVEGTRQGVIKGQVPSKNKGSSGLTDGVEIHGFSYGVISPRDAASGLPTGKRQHQPFRITKETDASSPLLFQHALAGASFDNPLSGLPSSGSGSGSGKVTLNPFNITKKTDSASPPLFQQALAGGSSGSFTGLPKGNPPPRGDAPGLPSGKRQHNPIVITKQVDSTSPLLLQALVGNELLRTVKISFTRIEPGRKHPWHTVVLTNALITKIDRVPVHGAKGPGEEIEFAFEKGEMSSGFTA